MSVLPATLPETVSGEERLARFILQSNRLRADRSVKPDAFIPYPLPDLSVSRHLGQTEHEIWAAGRSVAAQVDKPLYARADVVAVECTRHRLRVLAAPLPDNLAHANVTDWPPDKPSQKSIAQEIAAAVGPAILAPSAS